MKRELLRGRSYKWRQYIIRYDAHIKQDEHAPEQEKVKVYWHYVKALSIPDAMDRMVDEWIKNQWKEKLEYIVITGCWVDESVSEYVGDSDGYPLYKKIVV